MRKRLRDLDADPRGCRERAQWTAECTSAYMLLVSRGLAFLVAALAGSVIACSAPSDVPDEAPVIDEADVSSGDPEPACKRLAGLSPHPSERPDLAISRAHALARYFGPAASNAAVGQALAGALRDGNGEPSKSALVRFAVALEGVCPTSPARALGAAKVERRGSLAIVRPGSGEVSVPADARAVVIDLRDLPGGPETEQALAAAGAALGAKAALRAMVHVRTGLTDEAFAEHAIYTDMLEPRDVSPSPGVATVTRPLAVLVGQRITPEAARFAVALRVAGLAFVAGRSIDVSVAEMRLVPGPSIDVGVRTMDLLSASSSRLPDEIAADLAGDDASLESLVNRGAPPASDLSRPAARRALERRVDFGSVQAGDVDPAVARAALLSAHGAAKLFFPYFHDVGDRTDERLAETLAAAGSARSRDDVRHLIRRFGNVLEDGHNWTLDAVSPPVTPWPVVVDGVGGEPVVRRSYTSALAAGDRIVTIGSEPASTFFAREVSRSYGATPAFRFLTASAELASASRHLEVARPDGALRTVELPPGGDLTGDLYSGSTREQGWLTDLGASDVYYVNADGRYAKSDDHVFGGLETAAAARAIIIDMRGHPANEGAAWNPYALVSLIATADVAPPLYRVPVLDGAGGRTDVLPYQEKTPAYRALLQPVVLVTDTMSVSFAEDFSMLLASTGRLKAIVGRATAGTTGSVTGMQLPGGFQFFMTGMEARWPNGDRHFGRGVVPTILVEPTARDYAEGKDPMLARAVAELRAP